MSQQPSFRKYSGATVGSDRRVRPAEHDELAELLRLMADLATAARVRGQCGDADDVGPLHRLDQRRLFFDRVVDQLDVVPLLEQHGTDRRDTERREDVVAGVLTWRVVEAADACRLLLDQSGLVVDQVAAHRAPSAPLRVESPALRGTRRCRAGQCPVRTMPPDGFGRMDWPPRPSPSLEDPHKSTCSSTKLTSCSIFERWAAARTSAVDSPLLDNRLRPP